MDSIVSAGFVPHGEIAHHVHCLHDLVYLTICCAMTRLLLRERAMTGATFVFACNVDTDGCAFPSYVRIVTNLT